MRNFIRYAQVGSKKCNLKFYTSTLWKNNKLGKGFLIQKIIIVILQQIR